MKKIIGISAVALVLLVVIISISFKDKKGAGPSIKNRPESTVVESRVLEAKKMIVEQTKKVESQRDEKDDVKDKVRFQEIVNFEPNDHDRSLFEDMTNNKKLKPEELSKVEELYSKAAQAWEFKVWDLIVNKLSLGEEAFEKYQGIQSHFYSHLSQPLDPHRSDPESKKVVAEMTRKISSALKKRGIDLKNPQRAPNKEDEKLVREVFIEWQTKHEVNHLKEHQNKVKNLLGEDGFNQYKETKEDYNNKISLGKFLEVFPI